MKWIKSFQTLFPSVTYDQNLSEVPARDTRWDCLLDPNVACTCCDQPFGKLLSFAYLSPQIWADDMAPNVNAAFHATDQDILCEDFCRLNAKNYVRAILCLPLEGYDVPIVIGIWVLLEDDYLDRYITSFATDTQADIGPLFGWMANSIGNHPAPTPVILHPQNDRQRPLAQIAFEDHPLYVAQLDGLTFDQFETILQSCGHNLPKAD